MIHEWDAPMVATNVSGGMIHKTLRSDMHTLATNVISWAAFGQKIPWIRDRVASKYQSRKRDISGVSNNPNFIFAMEDTIQTVVQNLLLILIAPISLLRFFSPRYKDVFTAYNEFPLRIKDTIRKRKSKMKSKTIGTPGLLLDEMIKANVGITQQIQAVDGLGTNILTEDELTGNIFVSVLRISSGILANLTLDILCSRDGDNLQSR